MDESPVSVLLFEDDPVQAAMLQKMLAQSRKPVFSVQQVRTLADGLTQLVSRAFDVALVDLGLPDSQGLETALAVRNQAREMPIIVITASDDEEAALEALLSEIQDYLIKGEVTGSLLKRSIRYAIQRKRDIQAQRQSEQRFSSFMNNLPVLAWAKDMNGRYVLWNAENDPLFSPFFPEVGKTDEEVFPFETAQQLREHDARVLATGKSLQMMEVVRLADGADHHFVVNKFPILGADGRATAVGGIGLDITERVRAMEALRLSEARFRALHDENPAMIFTLDAEGMIISTNTACADHLRYGPDEMAGKQILGLFYEEDRADLINQLEMCRQNPNQVYRRQLRQIRQDGELLWVEEMARVVYDLNGALNVLVVCHDITDRKRAEEALQNSEKKFATVFQKVPALLTISTLEEGRLLDVNETVLTTMGYRRDEMIGHTALELNMWEDPSARAAIFKELQEKGEARNIEANFKGKDGQTFTGLFSAEYIDINGERYMLALVKDITQKRRALEQVERLNAQLAARAVELEEANRDLEAFNYTVAHDLRNPLNLIFGYCQIIIQACGNKLDEECKGYLQKSYDSIQRMNKLIATLLDFSRMARSELHRELLDISAMAHAVAAELKQSEPERNVELSISEGIMVDGDPDLLQVVLHNLLGNAWKYTAIVNEAVIEFGVTEIDGKTAFFVHDNGPGFDMADVGKLFIPFQRLAATVELKGLGIGLATVDRIIRRHGGRIWAEGEPGKGATFYFTLSARG